MLVTKLYGKCNKLGWCDCSGENGCGVEDDPNMYECDECGKTHMQGHNPHESKTKPYKAPSLSEIMDSPSPRVIANRAAVTPKPEKPPEKQAPKLVVAAKVPELPPALPCEVCGVDVELDGIEPKINRRAYCGDHHPMPIDVPELPQELMKLLQTAERITLEVGGVKVTIERQ